MIPKCIQALGGSVYAFRMTRNCPSPPDSKRTTTTFVASGATGANLVFYPPYSKHVGSGLSLPSLGVGSEAGLSRPFRVDCLPWAQLAIDADLPPCWAVSSEGLTADVAEGVLPGESEERLAGKFIALFSSCREERPIHTNLPGAELKVI